MQTYLFFISLFSLLFWGNVSQAKTHTDFSSEYAQHLTQQNQFRSSDTNVLWTIDEDNVDSIEEIHAVVKTKDKITSPAVSGKHFFCQSQPHNIPLFISDNRLNGFASASFHGYSSPIYITHRVLRI